MFDFLKKFKKQQVINSEGLSNQINTAIVVFQETIEQLNIVSTQANTTIQEHEAIIKTLQEENKNLQQTAARAEVMKEKLTHIFE